MVKKKAKKKAKHIVGCACGCGRPVELKEPAYATPQCKARAERRE